MIPSLSVLASFSAGPPPPPPPPPPGPSASINDRTVSKFGNGADPATASYELNSNGNVYNHAGTNLEAWLDSGVNADFQSRATFAGGDALDGGTLNTWQALSSSRAWVQTAAAGQLETTTLTIEIRLSASPFTVLDSASITITADNVG